MLPLATVVTYELKEPEYPAFYLPCRETTPSNRSDNFSAMLYRLWRVAMRQAWI